MDRRRLLAAVGGGVSTVLLVAVAVIELLAVEFSALVGLPVGAVAGLAAGAVLWARYGDASARLRRVTVAYGAFGLAVLGLLALRYVNVGRDVLAADVVVGAGAGVAVLSYVLLGASDRR